MILRKIITEMQWRNLKEAAKGAFAPHLIFKGPVYMKIEILSPPPIFTVIKAI